MWWIWGFEVVFIRQYLDTAFILVEENVLVINNRRLIITYYLAYYYDIIILYEFTYDG